MEAPFQHRLEQGARNLLTNCGECAAGDSLLIICELDDDGYYDPKMGPSIEAVARDLGMRTEILFVPLNRAASDPDAELARKMQAADCTVFLARLGDQIRFRPKSSNTTQVISYALDQEMLASPFGTVAYCAFERLKSLVHDAISQSSDVHVTCPAGTDFRGNPQAFMPKLGDTTLKRFPISVFAPIPAQGFYGRIAQNGFLTGTGSHYYTPWSCEVRETLFVHFKDSRIVRFEGAKRDVENAQAHYEFVGNRYGIDTYFVHSWHAGIHPGCAFDAPAGTNFERWGGSAFGNPRILHFHTCGAYPPGEISLNVLDPTVRLDGVPVWEAGKLHPDRIVGGAALLDAYPELADLFESPALQVGQAENGKLVYA